MPDSGKDSGSESVRTRFWRHAKCEPVDAFLILPDINNPTLSRVIYWPPAHDKRMLGSYPHIRTPPSRTGEQQEWCGESRMNRICCLFSCLAFSGLACAGEAGVLQPLVFNQAEDSLTPPITSMDATATAAVAELRWNDAELASRSLSNRDQRRASRERVFAALGVSRYIPSGHFMAFGNEGRWSLSLDDEDSVTMRMRVQW